MAFQLSGQITVTTAGTEVQGTDVKGEGFYVKAKSTNTGLIYIGNTGADVVSSTTGYILSAGDQVYIGIKNLNQIWVDSSVNGEGVSWLAVAPLQ